jgi:hypothetical protein
VVPNGELSAPDFWATYEYMLMYRQHHPRAVDLFEEFVEMIKDIQSLMEFNRSREPMFQVETMEFNLDDKIEEILQEKAHKFVQFCHVLMQARNKLRHDRITLYKHMIWESFEQKGLVFIVSYILHIDSLI